jgi:hypothetical protein
VAISADGALGSRKDCFGLDIEPQHRSERQASKYVYVRLLINTELTSPCYGSSMNLPPALRNFRAGITSSPLALKEVRNEKRTGEEGECWNETLGRRKK